jgi:carbon-monoxide dehydrogenase medium subunit
MKARAFLYRRPRDIDEAVALLGDNAGEAQVLAGGQSLMPTLNMRLSSPGMLVDINRIEALRGIEDRGAAIRIGALVRHADVLESKLIEQRLPLVAMAIPHVAHMAVRNRGTTCGSLALADPSAEMPAIAVALDAEIVLQKRGASRTISARDFFHGLYQTARSDDELIAEALFPPARANEVFGFSELSRRHGDFATVGVAVRARKTPRGLGHFDVVIFGSEPTPVLSPSAAKLTLDTDVADAALSDIAQDIAAEMNPIESHQGRGDTKRRQAAVLLKRVLKDMAGRAAHV